ncbi:MAG: ATP-binding protein [bacterium]|nr:ATP-binding protein [bacterium]
MTPEAPDTLSLRALLEEAQRLQRAAQYDEALALAASIEQMANAAGDTEAAHEALWLHGLVRFYMGSYETANDAAVRLLNIPDLSPRMEMRALQLTAMVYWQLGDLSNALLYVLRQLQIAETLGDPKFIASSLNGIALMYMSLGESQIALAYAERGLGIYRELDDQIGQAGILSNISKLHFQMKAYESALDAAQQSWLIYVRAGVETQPGNAALALIALARVHNALNQPEQAEMRLQEALRLSQNPLIPMRFGEALIGMGTVETVRQQHERAIRYYQEGLAVVEQHHMEHLFADSYEQLSDLLRSTGQFEQALAAYHQFHTLKTRIFNEESDKRLKALELRMNTEAAHKEADSYRVQAAQSEAQRAAEQAAYERINQVRDDLLASIRHDLKNPLTSISMSAYLLRRNPQGEHTDRWFDNIDMQVGRIQRMLTDVLDLVKLESRRALALELHDLGAIIDEARTVHDAAIHDKHIDFTTAIPPGMQIYADRERISRLFENLIANAVKFCHAGAHIRVSASTEPEPPDGSPLYSAIRVRDTGYGIPADDVPHIFERFYRVQRDTPDLPEGTGLGLSMVSTILEQHNGRITVESEVGVGSTFTVMLPAPPV